jgi:hypothetical protein
MNTTDNKINKIKFEEVIKQFYCQKCCSLGGIDFYNYKTNTMLVCQCCGHDNTQYIVDDSIQNHYWNYPKRINYNYKYE